MDQRRRLLISMFGPVRAIDDAVAAEAPAADRRWASVDDRVEVLGADS